MQEISGAYDPTVSLVTYGCEVTSGRIGDTALRDSIADYPEIYCSSALETIEYEALLWSGSVEAFSTNVLPAFECDQYQDSQFSSKSDPFPPLQESLPPPPSRMSFPEPPLKASLPSSPNR